jgi:hypothetical protein
MHSTMGAATEPISPELVLVCPELRAALHAAWRAGALELGLGGKRATAQLPAPAEAGIPRGTQGSRSLALAATVYLLSRTVWMLLQVALVLVLVSLAILAATGFFPG